MWFRPTPPRRGSCSPSGPSTGNQRDHSDPGTPGHAQPQGRDRDDRRHGNAEGDRPAHRRQGRGLRARAQGQPDQPARGRGAVLRRPRPGRRLRGERRKPTPATVGSRSAVAKPPRRSGSPNAIPSGRACVLSPPSPPDASTRRPAAKASKPDSISRPSNSIPRPSSPQHAPTGASRASTGRWT